MENPISFSELMSKLKEASPDAVKHNEREILAFLTMQREQAGAGASSRDPKVAAFIADLIKRLMDLDWPPVVAEDAVLRQRIMASVVVAAASAALIATGLNAVGIDDDDGGVPV